MISLSHDQESLLEVLTEGGGISSSNKAYRVKVIRGNPRHPKVYLFDFSSLEAYKNDDFVVQSGDLIYVEPALSLNDISSKVVSVLTLLSTLLLVYTTVHTLGK